MDINEFFPSATLKAEDIGNKRLELEIERVERGDESVDFKPVLHFVGKDKAMVLNKTNSMSLASSFGTTVESWAGNMLILCTHKVNFNGKVVAGLKVDPVTAMPDDDGGDIPF